MSTRYEYFNTGDNNWERIFDVNWWGQNFTPSAAHQITSVKLLLYKYGSPGQLTVSIRATDSNGAPTGSDLCSGTFDSSTLTTNTAGQWYEISLGSGYSLAAGTKYAIVCRATGGDSGNSVGWRVKSSGGYAGGSFLYSTNSGSSWDYNNYAAWDAMFEEWGDASTTPKTSSDSGSGTDATSLRELGTVETGSGTEAKLVAAAMLAGDGGNGSEMGGLLKSLYGSDIGSGLDKVKILTGKVGYDLRLHNQPDQVSITHKEVNL